MPVHLTQPLIDRVKILIYSGGNMETKIALIGTGGTIAGKVLQISDLTGYTAGVLGLDENFSLCTWYKTVWSLYICSV